MALLIRALTMVAALGLSCALDRACAQEVDPAVVHLLLAADDHHPALRQAREQLRGEYTEIGRANAAYRPRLSAQGRLLATQRNARLQTGLDFDEDATQRSASVTLEQTLYEGGRRGLAKQIAVLRVSIAEAALERSRREVYERLIDDAYGLAAARAIEGLQTRLIVALTEQVAAANARVNAGEASDTDVAIAQSRLELARAELLSAQLTRETAAAALASATGHTGGAPVVPLPTEAEAVTFAPDIIDRIVKADPAVEVAELREAIARGEKLLAMRAHSPVLALSASASTAEEVSPAIDESDELAVGLTLSVPLYRGGVGRAERQRAASDVLAAALAAREAERQARLQAQRLQAEIIAAAASVGAGQRRADAARQASQGFEVGSKAGFYGTRETVDAIAEEITAGIALVRARRDLAAGHAKLAIRLRRTPEAALDTLP